MSQVLLSAGTNIAIVGNTCLCDRTSPCPDLCLRLVGFLNRKTGRDASWTLLLINCPAVGDPRGKTLGWQLWTDQWMYLEDALQHRLEL